MSRWLWLSLAIIGCDQLAKQIAERLLTYGEPVPVGLFANWTLAHNFGAAFSFLASESGWQRWLLLALALGVSLFLAIWLIRLPASASRRLAVGLALVIGGAVGNMIDRALYGYVIDFIDLYHPALAGWPGFNDAGHWPIFNVADMAISCGAVLLIVDALFGARLE